MTLDKASAEAFTSTYLRLMVEVCVATDKRKKRELLQTLAEGREKCLKNAALLRKAKSALEARREPINAEAYRAIASMQFKRWIFLKDTKAYSVFLDPTGKAAYAVLGLTDRIRDIIGDTGALIETALVRYRGRFVCDGLISSVLWLGPNYRREYTALLKRLKADGRFHTTYEP